MNSCTGGVPRGGLWGSGPSPHPQPHSPAAPPGTPPWPDTAPSPAPTSCLWGDQQGPGSPPSSLSPWELGSGPAPHGRHWSPSVGRLVGIGGPLPVVICRVIRGTVGPGATPSPAPPSRRSPALARAHRGRQSLHCRLLPASLRQRPPCSTPPPVVSARHSEQ